MFKEESLISIRCVHGGFVLSTLDATDPVQTKIRTEVFQTQAKMLKSLRTALENQSLVQKTKAEKDE